MSREDYAVALWINDAGKEGWQPIAGKEKKIKFSNLGGQDSRWTEGGGLPWLYRSKARAMRVARRQRERQLRRASSFEYVRRERPE